VVLELISSAACELLLKCLRDIARTLVGNALHETDILLAQVKLRVRVVAYNWVPLLL
jgi:hypothetical protein